MAGSRGKKIALIAACVIGIPLVVIGIWLGPVAYSAWKEGFFEQHDDRTYEAGRRENLEAMHLALMLTYDSEGVIPTDWMDAAWIRVQAGDLPTEEAEKKLIRPGVTGEGNHGYALNDQLAETDIEDMPGDTILIFESEDLSRNAAGEPPADAMAVTLDGTILNAP